MENLGPLRHWQSQIVQRNAGTEKDANVEFYHVTKLKLIWFPMYKIYKMDYLLLKATRNPCEVETLVIQFSLFLFSQSTR